MFEKAKSAFWSFFRTIWEYYNNIFRGEPKRVRETSQEYTTNPRAKPNCKKPNNKSEITQMLHTIQTYSATINHLQSIVNYQDASLTAAAERERSEKWEKGEYIRRIKALEQENSKAREKIIIMTKKIKETDADLYTAQDRIASQDKQLSQDKKRLEKLYVSAISMLAQDMSRDVTDNSIRTELGNIFQHELLSWCADMCTTQTVDSKRAMRVLKGGDIFNLEFNFNLPDGRSALILLQAALAKFLCYHFLTHAYFLASDPVSLINFEQTLATTSLAMSVDWRLRTVRCLEETTTYNASFLAQEFETECGFLLQNMDQKPREDLTIIIARFAQLCIKLWQIPAMIEIIGVTGLAKLGVEQQDKFIDYEPYTQYQSRDLVNNHRIGAVIRPLILAYPVSEKGKPPVIWSKALVWVK